MYETPRGRLMAPAAPVCPPSCSISSPLAPSSLPASLPASLLLQVLRAQSSLHSRPSRHQNRCRVCGNERERERRVCGAPGTDHQTRGTRGLRAVCRAVARPRCRWSGPSRRSRPGPRAVGESSVILLALSPQSLLKTLLNVEGRCSRMTEVSAFAAAGTSRSTSPSSSQRSTS